MVAVVAHDAIKQPAHPDGDKWLVVWVAPDGRAIFADSITDVIGEVITGYADLDDSDPNADPHLEARIATLASLGSSAQAAILQHDGAEHFTEEELTALLTPKELPVGIETWNPSTPLLLLTTTYAPFTEHKVPEGSVVWLDPVTEVTFLSAMQTLGYGELWVSG